MDPVREFRRLILAGVGGLTMLCAVGGVLLSIVEQVEYLQGVWLAFSVVSTTGFGQGPSTSGGMGISMALFVLAMPAYVALVAGAVMAAQELNPTVAARPRPMLVERDVRRVVEDLNRN